MQKKSRENEKDRKQIFKIDKKRDRKKEIRDIKILKVS